MTVVELVEWAQAITVERNCYGITVSKGDFFMTYNGYTEEEAVEKFKQELKRRKR